MWSAYLRAIGGHDNATAPSSWHFCDNQHDADECADLAARGIKRATAASLWWFEVTGTPLPKPGDLHVVTNWSGEAQCVIRTTSVDVVPFNEVSADHAAAEGEGDRSLEFWRRVHWDYYHRELSGSPYMPREDMPIVCERFEVVFPVRESE
jgi:uncharacterized protein YhfF